MCLVRFIRCNLRHNERRQQQQLQFFLHRRSIVCPDSRNWNFTNFDHFGWTLWSNTNSRTYYSYLTFQEFSIINPLSTHITTTFDWTDDVMIDSLTIALSYFISNDALNLHLLFYLTVLAFFYSLRCRFFSYFLN